MTESAPTATERVTADDLALAATWLESYDASEDTDAAAEAMHRVARWLRAEEARRIMAARERELVTYAMQKHGLSRAEATTAARRAMAEAATIVHNTRS